MRRVPGLLAGAAAAAVGALILGEYELTGFTPVVAGILFGLIVAELVTVVGKARDVVTAAVSAALAAGGLLWAAWIFAAHDWDYVPRGAWVGAALAAAAAFLWIRTPGRRAAGTRRGT